MDTCVKNEESVECNAMHWGVCNPPDLFPPPRIYASCVAFKTPDIIPWSTYRGLRVRLYCHCHKVSVRQFPDSGCPPSFVFWIITVNVKFAWTPLAPRPRSTLLLLWSPLCCVLVYTWCIPGTLQTPPRLTRGPFYGVTPRCYRGRYASKYPWQKIRQRPRHGACGAWEDGWLLQLASKQRPIIRMTGMEEERWVES